MFPYFWIAMNILEVSLFANNTKCCSTVEICGVKLSNSDCNQYFLPDSEIFRKEYALT